MRAVVALASVALLGALTAFALPLAGRAANPTLIATVNDDYTISLTDSQGSAVTSLQPGLYDIEVHDNSALHNFHLTGPGVDKSTTVPETTTVTWTVDLTAGAYHFQCDAHSYSMNGDFTVTGSTTSTGATSTAATSTAGSTTAPTTAPAATTTAPTTNPPPPPPRRCRVPNVVGKRLSTARGRLAAAHCRLGRVSTQRSRKPRGQVLAQKPRAGRLLPNGGRVSVVVSRGRARR